MTDDTTLGGYFTVHERPPAFEGIDGGAYSVALFVDDAPGADGRFGGALLFVRWSESGDAPAGHAETKYLVWGESPAAVNDGLRSLTLHQVKAELDRALAAQRDTPAW